MQNTLVGSSEKRNSKQSKCSHVLKNLHVIENRHKKFTVKPRNVQWYPEVQNIEAEYKTEAQQVHISNGSTHYVYTMHCIMKAN